MLGKRFLIKIRENFWLLKKELNFEKKTDIEKNKKDLKTPTVSQVHWKYTREIKLLVTSSLLIDYGK
jgi:hypothetical protein